MRAQIGEQTKTHNKCIQRTEENIELEAEAETEKMNGILTSTKYPAQLK
jgi:hypothetical protein